MYDLGTGRRPISETVEMGSQRSRRAKNEIQSKKKWKKRMSNLRKIRKTRCPISGKWGKKIAPDMEWRGTVSSNKQEMIEIAQNRRNMDVRSQTNG